MKSRYIKYVATVTFKWLLPLDIVKKVGTELQTKYAIFNFNEELEIIVNNVQCQQQNPSHHLSTLLQFNVFLCLHIWQDVHAALQQSPQNYRQLDAGMWRYHANRMDARCSQFDLGRVDAYI